MLLRGDAAVHMFPLRVAALSHSPQHWTAALGRGSMARQVVPRGITTTPPAVRARGSDQRENDRGGSR